MLEIPGQEVISALSRGDADVQGVFLAAWWDRGFREKQIRQPTGPPNLFRYAAFSTSGFV
jgi:hypothetical protein